MPSRSYARTSAALGLAALALEALPTACGGVYPRHGADGAGSYDHPDYPLVMVEVEVGGEISFGLPDALHSGPAHSEDLCIHPSPDAQQPEATTYSSEPYRISALHTVVFTDAVATPMPTQCVVHQVSCAPLAARRRPANSYQNARRPTPDTRRPPSSQQTPPRPGGRPRGLLEAGGVRRHDLPAQRQLPAPLPPSK